MKKKTEKLLAILYISQVYFYSATAGSGIAVEYPDIIIHAISRQDGRPSIYCQLEQDRFFPNQQLPEDEEERQDIVTELKFMPQDPGTCKLYIFPFLGVDG